MDDSALLRSIAVKLGVTPDASVTIGKLFLKYKLARPRGRAWQMERNLLRPFILRYWRRDARAISAADWIEHRRQRKREKTRLGRPPSDLTLNLELARAKQMFRWAVKQKLVGERPFADVRAVKTRTRRGSWFNEPQIDRLLEHAVYLRWRPQQVAFYALVAVMADTGLRISEALSLRWDRITIAGVTSVLGKGSKTRVIAFTSRALEAIRKLDKHPINPLVFLNWKSGKRWDPSTVRRWFRTVLDASGLHSVKVDGDLALVPHILRHSFASIADDRGAPPALIQASLGHASPSTTAVYLHRSEMDAARRMADIMGNPVRRGPRRSVHKNAMGSDHDLALQVRGRVQPVS